MKVRRYFAEDMAQGLKMVREQQGPDAVIISNRAIDGGVELIAAEDYDESLLQGRQNEAEDNRKLPIEERVLAMQDARKLTQDENGEQDSDEEDMVSRLLTDTQDDKRSEKTDSSKAKPANTGSIKQQAQERKAPQLIWTHEPMMDQMQQELKSLRGLLEQQVSGLAWGNFGQQHPLRASLLRRLTALGLNATVSRELVDQVPEQLPADEAWNRTLGLLAAALPTDSDSILARGGVIALVGPPGAGKTTLLCKLAARHALIHGKDSVALISTDTLRIGAFEQLRSFGRIAGVPVWSAGNGLELQQALEHVYHRRLVLIDTAGIGHRNEMLKHQMQILEQNSRMLQSCLVLPSIMQSLALEQLIEAYRPVNPGCCVITHMDEAVSLGPVLSAIIDNQLPISYVSDGQSIPEDLHAVKSHQLVQTAVSIQHERVLTADAAMLQDLDADEAAHV